MYTCVKLFSHGQLWSGSRLQQFLLTGYIKPIDISSSFCVCLRPSFGFAICRLVTPNKQEYDDALQQDYNRPSNPSKDRLSCLRFRESPPSLRALFWETCRTKRSIRIVLEVGIC